MSAIVKICRKHGKLKIDGVIKSGKSNAGTPQFKCKQCMKDAHRNHYQNNKEKILEKTKEYRKNNTDRYKELGKKYRENKEKIIMERHLTKTQRGFTTPQRFADCRKLRIAKRKLLYLLFDIDKVIRKCGLTT